MLHRLKMGDGQLTAHEYRKSQRKITSMVIFFDKNMKFCILVVHDLTNDISFDAKLNRLYIAIFWVT